jgi:hypothetical protein
MESPIRELQSRNRPVWLTHPKEHEELMKRRDMAFDVAMKKLIYSRGNIENVMQIGEAFGRGLFADFVQGNNETWTLKKWLEVTVEQIFNRLGNAFTFTEINEDEAHALMTKCRLHEQTNEPHTASLFSYGFIRSLFLSAFPKGELLMGNTMAHGAPMTEFTFKTQASYPDHFERERVKQSFTITKKL